MDLSRSVGEAAFRKAAVDVICHRERSTHGFHSPINTVRGITFSTNEWRESRFRVRLYRFMAESIPLVGAVIWTWARLAAAPGRFIFIRDDRSVEDPHADLILKDLFQRINRICFGRAGNQEDFLPPFFQSLYLDGAVLGRIELASDVSAVDGYRFFDPARTEIEIGPSGDIRALESTDAGETVHAGPDLFYYALNASLTNPYGRSILGAVPFVAYIEQQLLDDMRRSMHNAGYHRLHVKIHPPDKREGESDEAYAGRANAYFDSTVGMIRAIEPEDNPVTWDDVTIEHIGPSGPGGAKTSNWYLNHRAMIEEICSGTHLSPFLLGYSYNATTNWAQFKYDLVMRQVRSVQSAAINFLNWLANIELALKGCACRAEWRFDNALPALAGEQAEVKSKEAAGIISLYTAGLIDKETACRAAGRLV
jgi:hypothetical protein